MWGPDFPLPVNLEWICRQRILFFFFLASDGPKKCWGNDKKGGNEQQNSRMGGSQQMSTHSLEFPFPFHTIKKKKKYNWEEPGWTEGWGGEENVRASPWLFLISFHSVEICQNQGEEKKREHWNLREREDVCEKFHKMCFHFKVFCAEMTATFAWVLLIFQPFFCALRGNRLRPKQSKCFSELCYPRSNSRKPSGNETWGSTSALL